MRDTASQIASLVMDEIENSGMINKDRLTTCIYNALVVDREKKAEPVENLDGDALAAFAAILKGEIFKDYTPTLPVRTAGYGVPPRRELTEYVPPEVDWASWLNYAASVRNGGGN